MQSLPSVEGTVKLGKSTFSQTRMRLMGENEGSGVVLTCREAIFDVETLLTGDFRRQNRVFDAGPEKRTLGDGQTGQK